MDKNITQKLLNRCFFFLILRLFYELHFCENYSVSFFICYSDFQISLQEKNREFSYAVQTASFLVSKDIHLPQQQGIIVRWKKGHILSATRATESFAATQDQVAQQDFHTCLCTRNQACTHIIADKRNHVCILLQQVLIRDADKKQQRLLLRETTSATDTRNCLVRF